MPRSAGQKTKLLHILTYLQDASDEQHPVTLSQIIAYLEKQGIPAERKSIYSDLSCLQEFGYTIEKQKQRTTGYYLSERLFTPGELKLLCDCIASSKFISAKKTGQLVSKLGTLTSSHQAKTLSRQIYVKGRKKSGNERIYQDVDTIHAAIAQEVQLKFQYRQYAPDKKKILRQAGKDYQVSPYAVTFDQENYYLLAYHEKYQDISSFRVDRMENIRLTDLPGEQVSFDLQQYLTQSFSMFSGDSVTMTLEIDNELIGVIIDKFGEDVPIKKQSDKTFILAVPVVPSPAFWGWLFQLGSGAKLLKPKTAVAQYKEHLKSARKRYKE